jgi:transposase
MPQPTDVANVCCAAIELSKSSWVIAFSPPAGGGRASVHQIDANDINRLLRCVEGARSRAECEASRPLDVVICFEVGYDGVWLARLLIERGIHTVVFDPASFLMPRKGRRAKTDRLDAEGMTRTLRAWLSGDREVARDVRIPTVEEEDAKRIERERKHLVEQRTSIVGRIKGLLALHGIRLSGKRIGKGLRDSLDYIRTGDKRSLAPFLRRDIERMLLHYEFISDQIKEAEAHRKIALTDDSGKFPHREKVHRLTTLGAVGETTATVLVAEVYHRTFATRRHVASFVGLAPSPYASGEKSRDRGISKAGTKLARQTFVELAWFWLRYQPNSKLSLWWHERFGGKGMRGRKVGIVALARKLAIALWRFVEEGVIPEGATLKA